MLQSRVHIVIVREICARIGFGLRCVESIIEYEQIMKIVSNCDIVTLINEDEILKRHRNSFNVSTLFHVGVATRTCTQGFH